MPTQCSLFGEVELEDLFKAYYSCRLRKRSTANALLFEQDYESNLLELQRELNDGSYKIGRSIAFVVDKPVKREIFAADFRDRVVQHYLINKIEPILEKQFIYDSYACRRGKGSLFGVRRVDRFIRSCSRNYARDAYVLKLDISGFFMNINKKLLADTLIDLVDREYYGYDKELILHLCKLTVLHDPTKDCHIKGSYFDWDGLPKTKSLFHTPPDCGLPIGNLSSQVLANLYLNSFDHYVKHTLAVRYYGRYVDDFVIVHNNKDFLLNLLPQIERFLESELKLKLHPRKIYLQHYSKGVNFLGATIKPGRIYLGNRTKGNFYTSLDNQEKLFEKHRSSLQYEELEHLLQVVNGFLGVMMHYNTYYLRQKMFARLSTNSRLIRVNKAISKIVILK